jgi:uncharacterized membrane protein required for colicin V production
VPPAPRESASRAFGAGWIWTGLVTAVLCGVLTAVALLLPPGMAGEVPDSALTSRSAPFCVQCPAPEQITGMSAVAEDHSYFVNVQLAAPVFDTRLRVHLDGHPAPIDLRPAADGQNWRASVDPTAQETLPLGLRARNTRVVMEFPAMLRLTGVAVETGSGDRFPPAGYQPIQFAASRAWNLADWLLIVILVFAGVRGYRRGLLVEASDFVGLAFVILAAAFFVRPVSSALAPFVSMRPLAVAIAAAVVLTVSGVIVYGLGGIFIARYRPAVLSQHPRANAWLGVPAACLRATVVIGMLVAVAMSLAPFRTLSFTAAHSLMVSRVSQVYSAAMGSLDP